LTGAVGVVRKAARQLATDDAVGVEDGLDEDEFKSSFLSDLRYRLGVFRNGVARLRIL
jgi:hypothetical protein